MPNEEGISWELFPNVTHFEEVLIQVSVPEKRC